MTPSRIALGPVGVTLSSGRWNALLGAATELERLGYSTIWVSGGQIDSLTRVGEVVRATRNVPIGTGIIAVNRFAPDAVADLYSEIEAAGPGRFLVGLGGAHGPKPLHTLGNYLDQLDQIPPRVPATSRVLAALGPRMLELARDRAAGALPLLVTPSYTARARALLGADSTLIIQQYVVLDTNAERARQAARVPIGFLATVPGYAAHFRRMGFAEDDIAELSDRFVDALTAWGDMDAITERIHEHHAAGADQVALTVLTTNSSEAVPIRQWRRLSEALIT